MALFTKNLEQIKKTAADIKAVKEKNRATLDAAKQNVDNIKTAMAEALEIGDIERYTAKAAELARANTAAKTAEDAYNVTASFPEIKENEVIAAWDARRPALDKEVTAAAKALDKAMKAYRDSYIDYARTLHNCRAERDQYLELIAPEMVHTVGTGINTFFMLIDAPQGFTDIVNPYDTGKQHPKLSEPLKWYVDDEAVQAARAVIETACASNLKF